MWVFTKLSYIFIISYKIEGWRYIIKSSKDLGEFLKENLYELKYWHMKID